MRDAVLRQIYRLGYWVLYLTAFLTRPHARGVKGVISNGGEVLFVRHTYGPHEWELPGGGQRRHETPLEALARELHEELGVTVAGATSLGTFSGPRQYRNVVVNYFSVELPSREVSADPVEIAEVRWFDPSAPPSPIGWYAKEALARSATR